MSETQLRLAATGPDNLSTQGSMDAERSKIVALNAFRSDDPEARLRDLLAFGLASEAARPLVAEDIHAFRRKAEAELNANAFRILHNRVQEIRLEAMTEQAARASAGAGYSRMILANLIAILLFVVGSVLVWGVAFATPEQTGPLLAAAGENLGSFLSTTAAAFETAYTWLGETLGRLYEKMAGKG